MRRWYANPEKNKWLWFYSRNEGERPRVSLPANRWRCLLDYCELLYYSRIPMIQPFVAKPSDAYMVNASLIWYGFVVRAGDPYGPRTEAVPVFQRALNPDRPIEDDAQLKQFLNEAWADAFLWWQPTAPAMPVLPAPSPATTLTAPGAPK